MAILALTGAQSTISERCAAASGYAAGPTLAYFTGGFAYGNKTNEFSNSNTGAVYKEDGMEAGYVLGGGVEYKINPNWSAKVEYQYIDLVHQNAPTRRATSTPSTRSSARSAWV